MTEIPGPVPVTVIIPAYNASGTIERCLESVFSQRIPPDEVILVDDCSADGTAGKAERFSGLRIIRTESNSGPALARNLGVESSTREIILFVDADVVIPEDTVSLVWEILEARPDVSAVQALYSPVCPAENAASRYQNFYYHYHLKKCHPERSAVFATYCAGIRKRAFLSIGGFDTSIPEPTVEDEELGYGLVDRGGKILIEHGLQVDHLAEYELGQLMRRRYRMSTAQVKNALRKTGSRLMGRYLSPSGGDTHHRPGVTASIACFWLFLVLSVASLAVLLLGGSPFPLLLPAAAALLSAVLLNLPFLAAAGRTMGVRTALVFVPVLLADLLALGAGVVRGAWQFVRGRRY